VKREARQRKSVLWRWIPALVLVVAAVAAFGWRPAIAPLPDGAQPAFDAALVRRGAHLAAIGQCASCHTVNPAAPYAGGLPIPTPFGTVYSTNITPDRETGIGNWTGVAFMRAMQVGIARDGQHLYPAFPYDHYTKLDERDIQALYAFMMTRDPLHAPAPQNSMRFPFGFRPLLAGWKLLFLDRSPVRPELTRGAEWNRGAYLADALGHCGDCHTPRNAFGAEDKRRYLGGGEAEGWYVPPLNASSPSPLPWTVGHLDLYLRTGIAPGHAIAGGPMQGVTTNLGEAEAADVRALAVYIASVMGKPDPAVAATVREAVSKPTSLPPAAPGDSAAQRQLQLGATVYADTCARCHDQGRTISSGGALQLQAAVTLYDPDPGSLIRIIRDGIQPPDGHPGRCMPAYAEILTDEQVIALAAYLRRYGANAAPWPQLAEAVQKAKSPP
jgi:mono/diheme cytochrome c family protein